MDEQKEKLLRQYLDGKLDEEREQEVLHTIADHPEMRSMLKFELQLRDIVPRLKKSGSYNVPDHFTEEVMEAIAFRESEAKRPSLAERLKEKFSSLWEPRVFELRPAYAALAVLVVGLMISLPYLGDEPSPVGQQLAEKENRQVQTIQKASAGNEQVWTRFVYIDDDAESMAVAGDFSDWEPTQLSKRTLNGQEAWTGLIPMNKGEHRYMFIKNGEKWVTDPLATNYEDDGFGNKNAVIYL